MAYVVTGATGHIGNNLVKRLIGLNQKVRIQQEEWMNQ